MMSDEIHTVETPVYMPLFWRDWLTGRATTRMTPEQTGGFLNLLLRAWDQPEPCTVPDDDTVLAIWSGMGAKWKTAGKAVRECFVPAGAGLLRNRKQWEVFQATVEKMEKTRARARKAAGARWEGHKSTNAQADARAHPQAMPEHMLKHDASMSSSNASIPYHGTDKQKGDANASLSHRNGTDALDEGFAEFWEARLVRDGTDRKAAAQKAWRARRRQKISREIIETAYERYRGHCQRKGFAGEKADRIMMLSTFLGDASNFDNPWGSQQNGDGVDPENPLHPHHPDYRQNPMGLTNRERWEVQREAQQRGEL